MSTITEGEGDGAAAGDTIVAHYVGVLSDGTTFDESWSGGQPITVTVGTGQVITGWDEGLIGAKIGERRHLLIGSDKAYGANGSPPAIPPNAPLAFDVDVVDIVPGEG
jgi:FKBP-type peptidyl-prolyl cis-trans isomerase